VDIYSSDGTGGSSKSPSIQRCIFDEYQRKRRKKEEVRFRKGLTEVGYFLELMLRKLVVHMCVWVIHYVLIHSDLFHNDLFYNELIHYAFGADRPFMASPRLGNLSA
jgi:hypothetical protein